MRIIGKETDSLLKRSLDSTKVFVQGTVWGATSTAKGVGQFLLGKTLDTTVIGGVVNQTLEQITLGKIGGDLVDGLEAKVRRVITNQGPDPDVVERFKSQFNTFVMDKAGATEGFRDAYIYFKAADNRMEFTKQDAAFYRGSSFWRAEFDSGESWQAKPSER